MDRGLLAPHAPTLRAIIEHAGVEPLADIAARPGVRAVYRLTAHYHDGRARDSVSTLVYRTGRGVQLETVIRVTFGGKPLVHPIPLGRYERLVAALHAVRFDDLADQPGLPPYGADLWLLERAAGSFSKSLILAPDRAEGAHLALVNALRTDLPEALREVR